ncbi:selenocysteine-specific translation elongation factor [Streptomyces sulfonofaciens]|uniref:Selenocysteine-specific translation elongation factor n=1 Tax=Streptomyces sulfonofaciens TaxID=68272 RepID=A0A919L9D8_9ACTN|nr:selenocysteine-specific translation elongation factor [Streptomyces sulfonofaciens]GHH87566.1 selenocysteine-specific translation elongation factor [Streptomyces sulfonofaciens]
MHVFATAGHVDHGKSALLRALTGMEPDRWAEERRRGMTLDLGFAWTRLPGAGDVAFVDVPGHERLVGNMLAGVGPVPAVLFVVAADRGWQPQSEEHLTVLDALGVRHGLLAVSRSDLADPAAARKEALDRIAESSLGEVASAAVSAVTGAGLDDLRTALARTARGLPAPDTEADVRLWADRVFTVRGLGTVVTGTLGAGTIRVGDHLACGRDGRPLRVRGLQTLKESRPEVSAVARVAVNLHGPGADALRRGDALLTPGHWLTTDTLDVRLTGDPARDLPRRLTLHAGSAAVPVAVRPLGEDTARLGLAAALPLRIGDRVLLRDPGRHRVAAGATLLDVRPPPLTRRGAAAARARDLEAVTGPPDGAAELRRRGLARRRDLLAMGVRPPSEPVAGEWLADPRHWAGLRDRLGRAVEEHAVHHPLEPGLPLETARQALGLPDRCLVEALLATEPGLRQRAGRLYGSRARPALPPEAEAAVAAVRADLALAPFRAPEAERLAQLGLTPRLLAAAEAAGALLRIADGIVLLPGADARAAALLSRLEQPFTTSAARQALDTTRRVAVPLLEHLDRQGCTVRLDGAVRRCRPPAGPGPGGGTG